MNKMIILILILAALTTSLYSEDTGKGEEEGRPAGYQFVLGPRLGVNYYNTSPEEFSDEVSEKFEDGDYFPVTSTFGLSLEQRILLGETRSHFVFQEVIMVSGLEQAIALPSVSILIGYRGSRGLEFGAGATISFSGVGVIVAAGWTLSFSGVYVPIDVSVILPNDRRPLSIALTTGFNFKIGGNRKD